MDDGKLFVSSDRKSSFKSSFYSRRVFSGRRVDLSDFRGTDIAAMIEAMGWTPIICMDHPIYPRLVKLFYCNLSFDRDLPSVTSLVNGTPIHLTTDSLAAMLGVPDEGVRHYKSGVWESNDGHTLDALRLVCEDGKIAVRSRPFVRSLPARSRLLHDMVMSVFLPRGHNRKRVSRMDLFLLKKILCGERANLPYMIIRHMIESIKNRYLPYGMLLSKIFVACNVEIPRSEMWRTLTKKEVYNSRSLIWMGYVLTEAGLKLKDAPGDLDEGQGMEDEEEPEEEEMAVAVMEEEEEPEEEETVVTEEKQGNEEKLTMVTMMAEEEEEEEEEEPEEEETVVTEEKQGKEEKPTTVTDGVSSNGSKSCSYEADDIQESLNQVSARVDSLALSLENLRRQQEQGFANLTTKLDFLMEFLNHHFWPYPPPPPPFAG